MVRAYREARRRAARRSQQGLSLVELVTAFGVLQVMVLAVISADTHHFDLMREALEESVARRAAAGALEELRAEPAALQLGEHAALLDTEAGELLGATEARLLVDRAPEAQGYDLYQVEARVRWEGRSRSPRTVSLVTWIARDDAP